MSLTQAQEMEYLNLLEQEDRERLSPGIERAHNANKPIVVVQGGRGAGAKSWSFASWVVQLCQYETHRAACLREVQLTLEESVYQLIIDTIQRLGYSKDWHITKERISNTRTQSFIIFRGLRDLRAANQIKGLEGFDIVWCDEAATIIDESWSKLMPTLVRNDGWRLFISYNPETDEDPCTLRFWNSTREDVERVRVEPGRKDNPWWNDGLENEMRQLYLDNPDEAEHVYGGRPRKQGDYCAISRVAIRAAMVREIEAVGVKEAGVDVARFGNDKTEMYRRQGLKVVKHKEMFHAETTDLANAIWDFVDHDPTIATKIDEGYNPGVIDCFRKLGGNGISISFGGSAKDKNKYDNCVTEMWFELPIDDAQIPNDPELSQQLGGRMFHYEKGTNVKIIESKDEYKVRYKGKSPDKADALLLCFYSPSYIISKKIREEMARRRAQGR